MGEHDGHRERLRQRFIQHGLDGLPDHEVLELLLFYALPRRDTNGLARSMLKTFGSLEKVLEASISDLQQIAGIGENAAALIHLVLPIARRYQLSKNEEGFVVKSIKGSAEYLMPYYLGEKEECIYIGDSDVDMMTGNAAGMLTVGVTWGFRSKDVLLAHGAHHTIDKAEELIAIVAGKGV